MAERWYEGMFIFDSSFAARETEEAEKHLKDLLEKHGATIHKFEKWDDRKLAYDIERVRRGYYFLVVYRMDADKVSALKRDCRLSERVVRELILQDDQMMMRLEERERLKVKREEEAAKAAAEGLPPRRRRS